MIDEKRVYTELDGVKLINMIGSKGVFANSLKGLEEKLEDAESNTIELKEVYFSDGKYSFFASDHMNYFIFYCIEKNDGFGTKLDESRLFNAATAHKMKGFEGSECIFSYDREYLEDNAHRKSRIQRLAKILDKSEVDRFESENGRAYLFCYVIKKIKEGKEI